MAYSKADLIEDERIRFESAFELHNGWKKGTLHRMRDGDGYGDRMLVVIAWWSWCVAVGLTQPGRKDAPNEHAVVDSHGQPLEGLLKTLSCSVR